MPSIDTITRLMLMVSWRSSSPPPEKGFYNVSFRVPGANTGTASGGGSGAGGGALSGVNPRTGARGNSVSVIAALASGGEPFQRPGQVTSSFLLGTLSGTGLIRVTDSTVRANFAIPANAAPGLVAVKVNFTGGPGGV